MKSSITERIRPDVSWIDSIPQHWRVLPLLACCHQHEHQNVGSHETNVLSLSYGRIVRRDVETNFGLLPGSFDAYNRVAPGDVVLRLTDLQNDVTSLRVGLVRQAGIITSAYVTLRPDAVQVKPEWLFYLLHAYDVKKVFYALGGGVSTTASGP